MINKQKIWFITLFSLILILSVYYITMPSDLLTVSTTTSDTEESTTTTTTTDEEVSQTDVLTALQVELDEERQALAAEYNEVLTSEDASVEEKSNAYDGLKQIDELKSQEEKLRNKIKESLELNSFVKIDGTNINVTVKSEDHDYSLANDIMRLINEEYDSKVYVSVKFQN